MIWLLENRVEQNQEPQDSQTMYSFQNFALSHLSKMLTKIVKHSETLKEKVTPKVKIQSSSTHPHADGKSGEVL